MYNLFKFEFSYYYHYIFINTLTFIINKNIIKIEKYYTKS